MTLYLIAFAAGFLTILTPCVLPVLPVMLGASLSGEDRYRPLIISASLMLSVFLFTLLLKASTLLIDIPQTFWTTVAAVIVIAFGLTLLFPDAWTKLSMALGFENSQKLLSSANAQGGTKGLILLGMALGPVFASCSPTYALILAVVLPQSLSLGISALLVYCLGLFVPLLLIGYGGRRVLKGFRWFADPTSWFRKFLGLLLVVVGLLIATGYDKKLEAALLNQGYFDFTKLEQGLVDEFDDLDISGEEETDMDQVMRASQLLADYGAAPELVNPQGWINSEPLTLAQLQSEGKVVVVDFWTYSCINCIRTFPALKALHDEYADDGLVILGVHAPEFAFERKRENVLRAAEENGLEYPIFLDNDFETWRAYNNRYWPAKYIIDKQGRVRYTHFGEGAYEETEEVIRLLLGEEGGEMIDFSAVDSPMSGVETGETYLGTRRHVIAGSLAALANNHQAVMVSPEQVSEEFQMYSRPARTELNHWWLEGEWSFSGEYVENHSADARLGIRYKASEINLVMSAVVEAVGVEVWLDGEKISDADTGKSVADALLEVNKDDLYSLADHGEIEEHELELRFTSPGVRAFAYTFG